MVRECLLQLLCHAGPSRGIPLELMKNSRTVKVDEHMLHEPDEAVTRFESCGSHLTLFSPFGEDPLKDNPQLANERERLFLEQFPDFSVFFHSVVNGDFDLFKQGLLCFVDVSFNLCASVS